jgi:hypothetical protein
MGNLKAYAGNPRQLNQPMKIMEIFTADIRMESHLGKC